MEASALIRKLHEFNSAEDENQLHALDELLQGMQPGSLNPEIYRALLQIFERFPESDGFGVFWSILHFLEGCTEYESYLVESVLHMPCQFNLNMVNRLINGGITNIEDTQLIVLLGSVSQSTQASESALYWAMSFLEHQKKKGLIA